MKILALAQKGHEFMYCASTARKVSNASAEKIRDIANENEYLFKKYPNSVWHIFDVDKYDTAYDYAQFQSFKIRKGIVSDCAVRW